MRTKLALALLLLPAFAHAQAFRVGSGIQIIPRTTAPTKATANGSIYIKSNDSNKLHYVKPDGTDAEVGGGGGAGTLTATYAAGASQTDSTIGLDSTRLGLRVRDHATPITGSLFAVQSDGGTNIFEVLAASVKLNVGLNPKTDTGAALGTSALRWSDVRGLTATFGGASSSNLTIGTTGGITVDGSSPIDFSGNSGAFKTTTGAATFGSSSYSLNSTFTANLGYSMPRCAANNTSIATTAASSVTTGNLVKFVQPVTITGIRFFWTGGVGALTVKATLYDSANSNVGSCTVAVDAAGVFSCTFTGVVVTSSLTYKTYTLSVWENSGARYSYLNAGGCLPATGNDNVLAQLSPWVLSTSSGVYSAGDARPTTEVGAANQYFPMEAIFSAP